MSRYHPVGKQLLTSSIPEVFHITRPLITNPRSSDGNEERICKSLHANDTVTTLNSKPTVMTQSETASPTNVPAVSTLSRGRGSGYRKRQSYVPVNSRTAILLPRPQISASVTHTNELQIQQIPVLNNTQFQFSRPVAVDARCSNDHISNTTFKQATQSYPNDNITHKEKHTLSKTSLPPHDNTSENSVTLCRNNNSRVRNTKENDARKDKLVNISENKYTEEKLASRRDKASKNLGKNVNSEVKLTGNVEHKRLDDETGRMENVKDQLVESVSASMLCYTNAQSEHCQKEGKSVRSIREVACAALEVDGSNLPSTSNLEIGEKSFAAVNMHIENDDVADTSTMSDTLQNRNGENTENTLVSDSRRLKFDEKDEKDMSNTDNVTEIINRVASGEVTTTISRNSSTRKQARASRKAKQGNKNHASTTEMGTEESETKNDANKLQHTTKVGVRMLRRKHPSKKSLKAKLDIESRYMGHALTAVSSFEEVLEGKSDVINQIETDKLSKVKDHHLLTLSDDEREYLRSKCYLENDLTVDVRRRFEPHAEGKNEKSIDKSSRDFIRSGSEDYPDCEQFEASTSSAAVNFKDRMKEHQLGNIGKETYKDEQNKFHADFKLKQPVVKLQRLGTIPTVKQEQGLQCRKPWKQDSTLRNSHTLNSTLPSRKIYYVINSNDIVRLQQQSPSAKAANSYASYKTAPEITSTVPGDSNVTVSSASTVNSTINKNSFSCTTIQTPKLSSRTEFDLKAAQRISVQDSQPNSSGSYSHNVDNNGEFKLKSSPASENLSLPARPYCNKLTVKELLRAKRENRYCGTLKNKQITPTHTHVQLSGKHIFENPSTLITQNLVKDTQSNVEMSVADKSSNRNQKSEPESLMHQQINQNKATTQPGRILHIVNPSLILAVPTFTHEYITSASDATAQPHITTEENVVSQAETREIQTGSQKKQPIYIKIGDQTMIVKRCESTRSTDKKTLPAPKPKYTDDYKRKHRRAKTRHSHRVHQQSLRSKLRKILQRSNEPVQKLVSTLDLVPVQLLKNFLETTVKEEPIGEDLPVDTNKSLMSPNRNEVINIKSTETREGKHQTKATSRKRKLSSSYQTKMANIMQISKRADGTVAYSTHQVRVRYAKAKSTGSFNPGILCRLKFSVDGFLEKIYAESIQQGFFLVQNCKGEEAYLKKNEKIDAVLVLYPPHIATVPDGSFCLAVGDLFSEEHKNQHKFETESTHIQKVLEQFLWPFSMQNVDDFMDKRYSSVTDRSMSPRCCSPLFYSSKMKDAFDIEENRTSGCDRSGFSASSSFSRNFETATGKIDRQSTRFSERAIALKIKQNELFETCRKLKSERTAKEENKHIAERTSQSGPLRSVTIQDDFVEGVRVLIPAVAEQNIFCKEMQYCISSNSQASPENDETDTNINVD